MPHDSPDVPELLRTAHEFVVRITGGLEGQDRYHAMCTAFLLEIAMRELEEWQPMPTADDKRLRDLLGDPERPREKLAADLCAAIRAGKFDDDMPALLDQLIRHVESKVRVAKPSYLAQAEN